VRTLPIVITLAASLSTPASGQELPRAQPEEVGMSSERLARIDSVMQSYVDQERTAGIAILVLRGGRVVKEGVYGWGDREARRVLRPDALFRIASQTKAVTSVAAMMLVEEGRLRLADPVDRWLPTFAEVTVAAGGGPEPARRVPTIRDLLTHSSGVSYGNEPAVRDQYRQAGLGPAAGYGWYLADKDEPVCETMDRIGGLPFVAHPGDRYVYGYSTDVLGCVVERVSGLSLDDFFRERIFQPLGMTESYFYVPPAASGRLTAVYSAERSGLTRAPEGAMGQGAYLEGPRRSYSGGAGLAATIEDYARFLQMLLDGGELNGVRLLAPHTVALMTTDHLGPLKTQPGLGFGLGFQVLEDPGLAARYGARGAYRWGGAYATDYWVDPTERVVALLMTQTLPSGGLDAADRFRTLVYSAILDSPVRQGGR
jgi:CubicO group peptidase (beta-lactamase class C family)